MKFVSLAASCATLMCSAHGDDVTIDWGKITDMQTDISFKAKNVPQPPISRADFSGHVQLDLFEKKLSLYVSGSEVIGRSRNPYYRFPLPPGTETHGESEIVVDASAGTIGIRARGTTSFGAVSADSNYCLVVKAPPQMLHLPPKSVMEMKLQPLAERIQQRANALPHTVEGGVVTYKSPPPPPYVVENHYAYGKAELQIHTDGVPIKFEAHEECDQVCARNGGIEGSEDLPSVEVSFDNWEEGSGEIGHFSCSEGSTTDISAYPHAMHAITAYDLLTHSFWTTR
jgi:hypothetical protein